MGLLLKSNHVRFDQLQDRHLSQFQPEIKFAPWIRWVMASISTASELVMSSEAIESIDFCLRDTAVYLACLWARIIAGTDFLVQQ